MTINAKLKEYMVNNGIRSSFIANKTGLSNTTISNILNGKRKITAEELSKICKALNVHADMFLN